MITSPKIRTNPALSRQRLMRKCMRRIVQHKNGLFSLPVLRYIHRTLNTSAHTHMFYSLFQQEWAQCCSKSRIHLNSELLFLNIPNLETRIQETVALGDLNPASKSESQEGYQLHGCLARASILKVNLEFTHP